MKDDLRIWHYGLVARWWAEFNQGGKDIEYFRRAISDSGEPALDAGCGTGRVLVPLVQAGLDVDGCDASADMLEWCRKRAVSLGLTVALYPQPMHELDLPRLYRTIVICGAFGLGGTRAQDLEGLRQIRAHLQPGGTLIMDHTLPPPRSDGAKERIEWPQAWPERGERRRSQDGSELEMRWRLLHFDPDQRIATREICVGHYEEGVEVARETSAIDICVYSQREIEVLLATAGFAKIRVTGGLSDQPPRAEEDSLVVFHATA